MFYVLSFLNHRFLIFCVSLNIRNISWRYSCVERVLWNINYSLISVHVWYSRHTDEGRVAAIEEGAVEHLQDEGEVLKRQVWGGGTNGKQQALQGRQEERKHRRPQVHLLLALPYKHNNDLRLKSACRSLWICSQPEGLRLFRWDWRLKWTKLCRLCSQSSQTNLYILYASFLSSPLSLVWNKVKLKQNFKQGIKRLV